MPTRRLVDLLRGRAGADNGPRAAPVLAFEDIDRSFVLLSQPRAGAHMLRETLRKVAGLDPVVEPFEAQDAYGKPGYSVRDFVRATPEATFLSDRGLMVHGFLAEFFDRAPEDGKICLDIRHPQAYVFGVNPGMAVDAVTPVLIEEIVNLKIPIVHLVRRDAVALAASALVAERSQAASHRIPPADVAQRALEQRRMTLEMSRVLDALGARSLTVGFEDLLTADWRAHLRRVLSFIDCYADIPFDFAGPDGRPGSLSQVENAEEIRAHLAALDPMLATSFGQVWHPAI